jgi:hypothetical protein
LKTYSEASVDCFLRSMFVLLMAVIAFGVVMHWKDTLDEIADLHAPLRFRWLRF